MSFPLKAALFGLLLLQPLALRADTPPLTELRATRSEQLAFLHPDMFMRADLVWPAASMTDGEVADVAETLRAALQDEDFGAVEHRVTALVSMNPLSSDLWLQAANLLNRSEALANAADPMTRLACRELAVSVALNAWLTAQDEALGASALDVLAEALVQIGDLEDAASVGRLRLSITPDDTLQASIETWTQDIDQLGAPQPQSYPDIAPVERYFGNWTVACDNAGSCSATNTASIDQNYGARIDLTRDAGPFAAPHLSLSLRAIRYAEDGSQQPWVPLGTDNVFVADPVTHQGPVYPASQVLVLSGTDWTRIEYDDFYLAQVSAADLRQMIEVLTGQPQIAFGETEPEVWLDLNGAAQAFGFIDEFQGRAGTETALVAPGTDRDIFVPMPGRLPVTPVALVDGTQIDGTAPVEVLDYFLDNCADAGPDLAPSIGFRMRPDLDLWFVLCSSGAYNAQYMGFSLQADGTLRKLDFPDMIVVDETPGHPVSRDLVWGFGIWRDLDMVSYDPTPKTGPQPFLLVATNLGRGLGDCGERFEYLFDGNDFQLGTKTQMDCTGWATGWPYVWRSGRFGAPGPAAGAGLAQEPVVASESDVPDQGDGIASEDAMADYVSNAFYSPAYEACVTDADSHQQAICADEENARWDDRLNAAYKAVMASDISPEARKYLKAGQRSWIEARDAFCPLTAQLIDGSMAVAAVSFCTARMTALRTEFLEPLAGIYSDEPAGTFRLDGQRFSADYQHCAGDAAGEPDAVTCERLEEQGLGGDIDAMIDPLFSALDKDGQASLMRYIFAADADRKNSCDALGMVTGSEVAAAHCRTVATALQRGLMITWAVDPSMALGSGE